MSSVDPTTLARILVEDRLREASRARLANDCRRSEKPDVVPTSRRRPRRGGLGMVLARLRSAYG
jgi:hypothetical protein